MESEEELIEELLSIAKRMGGGLERLTTTNSSGRTAKKIVIEYDVKQKE